MIQYASTFGLRALAWRYALVLAGVVLAVAAMIAGCTSAPVKSAPMIDPKADFDSFETFGWYSEAGSESAARPTSLLDTTIRAAIATELTRKGYVEASERGAADLLIEYQTARTDKIKSNPFRVGVGVGSFGGNVGGSVSTGTPSARNVTEGSLVIHAVDPVRNVEVWQSRISGELGEGTVAPEVVQSAVSELLSDFPARKSAP